MIQKFYTMLQEDEIKSFKLKVGLISSKTGAPIQAVDGPSDSAEGGLQGGSEVFQSMVPNANKELQSPAEP